MKSKIDIKKIAWPERFVEGVRVGPSIILPLRVLALIILIQSMLGFMIGVLFIGNIKVFSMAVRKVLLKDAKIESLEIDNLKVKMLQIEQKV